MSSPSFSIRAAQLRDLPRITTVCLAGIPDDPTFGLLARYRSQYPEDTYFFWLQKFKDDLFNPRITFLVAVQSASNEHKNEDRGEELETIVAFALWERNEAGSRISHFFNSLGSSGPWDALHRVITKIENWAIGKEFKRRDIDYNRAIPYLSAMNKVHAEYWEKKYPQNYYFVLLVTHPDYRRRGAGTMLTQWGIDRALAAGFDVGLEASPMGLPLYKHLGFVLQDTLIVEPENDDVVFTINVMLYDKNKNDLKLQMHGLFSEARQIV